MISYNLVEDLTKLDSLQDVQRRKLEWLQVQSFILFQSSKIVRPQRLKHSWIVDSMLDESSAKSFSYHWNCIEPWLNIKTW